MTESQENQNEEQEELETEEESQNEDTSLKSQFPELLANPTSRKRAKKKPEEIAVQISKDTVNRVHSSERYRRYAKAKKAIRKKKD